MTKEELYLKAFAKFGSKIQIINAIEELAELQKELCKYLINKGDLEKIADEMADVEIKMEQLLWYFDCGKQKDLYKAVKLKRLEERIENL